MSFLHKLFGIKVKSTDAPQVASGCLSMETEDSLASFPKNSGKYITQLVDGVPTWEHAEKNKNDLEIMLKCCDSELKTMKRTKIVAAPFYFERSAMLFRKSKQYDREIEICERYIQAVENHYSSATKNYETDVRKGPRFRAIKARIEKAKELQDGARGTKTDTTSARRIPSALRGITDAEEIGIQYLEIPLERGSGKGRKNWICPKTNQPVRAEEAVLAHFGINGWRGYADGGGLLLNLIKAMSFLTVPQGHQTTYVEAIYAQNVASVENRFSVKSMLSYVAIANKRIVEKNFDIMASSTSMSEYFPNLERWMLVELLEVAGNNLLHSIAKKFAQDPYEYRRGWPNITMWKNKELKFIYVKTPGNRLIESQTTIIKEFAKPLRLNFSLANIKDEINFIGVNKNYCNLS